MNWKGSVYVFWQTDGPGVPSGWWAKRLPEAPANQQARQQGGRLDSRLLTAATRRLGLAPSGNATGFRPTVIIK